MSRVTYSRHEVARNFRNWRLLIMSLAFPLVLYFAVAGANRHATFNGIAFTLYFMAAMATLGSMTSVVSSGAAIAAERSTGWTRQMRITPLGAGTYFGTKMLCGYLRAVLTIAVVCLSGVALGVRLPADKWLTVTGLLLVGLAPFAVLGIMLGHVLGADVSAMAIAGVVTLFALLGGVYGFQVASSGPVFELIKAIPSYWLVQAAKTALGHGTWPAEGWIVVAAWTAALIPLALVVYRRDTSR